MDQHRVWKLLVSVLMISKLSYQQNQTTPLERCEAAGDGNNVCLDCSKIGKCTLNTDGTTYTLEYLSECLTSPQTYCDDTLYDSAADYGQCAPLPSTYTVCGCSTETGCIADPNNPSAILHCESTPPVTDPPCSAPELDLASCSCATCSDTCPLLDDTSDSCSKYYFCNGNNLVASTCNSGLCFDQDACKCLESGGATTTESGGGSTTPVDITTTSATLTCTTDCNYVDDPNDDCQKFYYCDGTDLVSMSCPGVLCFYQDQCSCA